MELIAITGLDLSPFSASRILNSVNDMEYDEESRWDKPATLSTYVTLGDISEATRSTTDSKQYESPVLKLIGESKKKNYQKLCIPLTTEKWKERWSKMCLLPSESSEEDKELAAKSAEKWRLNPAFERGEVNITRLGTYRKQS